MPAPSRSDLIWASINAIGAGLFLSIAASCCWIEPELANEPGASAGDAFVWAIYALPIFTVFVLTDLAILVTALWRKKKMSAVLSGLLLASWIAVFLLDRAHHGI